MLAVEEPVQGFNVTTLIQDGCPHLAAASRVPLAQRFLGPGDLERAVRSDRDRVAQSARGRDRRAEDKHGLRALAAAPVWVGGRPARRLAACAFPGSVASRADAGSRPKRAARRPARPSPLSDTDRRVTDGDENEPWWPKQPGMIKVNFAPRGQDGPHQMHGAWAKWERAVEHHFELRKTAPEWLEDAWRIEAEFDAERVSRWFNWLAVTVGAGHACSYRC